MSKTYKSLSEFQQYYQYDLSDEKSHLGEGTYGQVVKAWDNTEHRYVALKIGKDLMPEFLAAKDLSHRNIAKYIDCYRITDKSIGTRDYAIMQLYPEGNLAIFLANNTISQTQQKQIIRGILEGLKYLHAHKRIHRDLKPANILIFRNIDTHEIVPLISDFGLTKVVKENDYVDGSDVQLSDGKGTPSYKAPEQIEGEQAHYNLDLWAFGVILYEMLLGERPFTTGKTGNESQRFNELLRQIKEVVIPEKLSTIQQPYQAIIRKCLVKDIHRRIRRADELIDMLVGIKEHEQKTDKAEEKRTAEPKEEKKKIEQPTRKEFGWFEFASIFIAICTSILVVREYSKKDYTERGRYSGTFDSMAVDTTMAVDTLAAPQTYTGTLTGLFDSADDEFSYTGEVTNQVPNGYGKSSFTNGDSYDGYYINGKQEGKGTYLFKNGDKYDGEWKDGWKNGKGTYTWVSGEKYYGEWKDDKQDGKGIYTWVSGNKYNGEWKDDRQNGKGIYTWVSGNKYEGEWKDSKQDGKGIYTWPNGTKYEGEYKNDKKDGQGIYTCGRGFEVLHCPECIRYEGEWKENLKQGKGRCYGINNILIYEGLFRNNEPIQRYPN